jgi:hypothetical protein
MLARFVTIAAAALTVAAPAAAEPARPQTQETAQPASRPIVLASADAVKTPAAASDQQAPVKRPRVGRVTTCRCGDQIPQEDDSQQ